MQRLVTTSIFTFFCVISIFAQQSVIEGKVLNYINHEPLPFATIRVLESDLGTVADSSGYFKMELPAGLYNLEASFTGFNSLILHEIKTLSSKPVFLDFELRSDGNDLSAVEVTAEAFRNTSESPLALQRINLHELERMPGATLDVSKFVKTLPGVSPKVSFGYNLIVRGGASNENKFFLDGMEIPAITHFTVQGTSGGPNGLLNVLMLENASLHSSAFPAYAGNALSSVMAFHQREGRKDRFGGAFSLGANDWGILLEGPMGKKSSFVFSARESYTQHVLKAIGVPVIPFYADVQYKQVIHFDDKNELTLTGVGGYDKYTLNLGAEPTESLLYNTGYIPEGKQFVYAAGAIYKHYLDNSYYTVVLSRNHFYNYAEKFINNSLMEVDRLFDYTSKESENKLRLEHKIFKDNKEWNYGIAMETNQVDIQEYSLSSRAANSIDEINFHSIMNFFRYGAFGSFSQKFLDDKVSFYAGLRLDGNTYSDLMNNPLKQISPRIALSWQLRKDWQLSANAGRYFQVPPYILMAFAEDSKFTNRDHLKYMRSDHLGLGIEHTTSNGYRLKLEGFHKKYNDYPFLLRDSISYANANANFVLVGDQPADASSEGQAYGIEFQIKQKYRKSWSWSFAYSFVVSQFEDTKKELVSSAWDNRHFGTLTIGKTFGKNWQVGMKWSVAGGNPYTPYDQATSALRSVWDVNYRGIPDFSRLNEEKLPAFHQLDIRIDKQFNFKKWSLALFMDIQNVYSSSVPVLPYLTVERNEDLTPVVDADNTDRYKTKLIDSDTGRVLPSIGFVAEF